MSAACSYEYKPFYYMEEEWADSGYVQLFPHVSYVVRFDNRAADLTDCYDDHWRLHANVKPTAPDLTVDTDGSEIHVHPLTAATDPNPEDAGRLVIRGVAAATSGSPTSSTTTAAGGTATVTVGDTDEVAYRPPTGAWTTDSFYVTISDHDLNSSPIKVTVIHSGVNNGAFNDGMAGWSVSSTATAYAVSGNAGAPDPTPGTFARTVVPGSGGTATLKQTFTVPTTGTQQMIMYRKGYTYEPSASPARDNFEVRVTSGGNTQVLATSTNKDVPANWTRYQYDLSAYKGQTVELKFTATGGNDNYTTYFSVDGIRFSTPADHWVARVNAGGTAVAANDAGPDWAQDTANVPSSYHNTNSNVVDYGSLSITRGANLPASTPTAIFSTERWSPNDSPTMQWDFLATVGHHLTVRLYFSNDYGQTSQPGQRKFNVAIDGTTVLSNYDIVADVGNHVGTMKSFNITSDGNVDIDFSHVLENPLINGIEIIDNDVPAP
jgi:hypothetical protein